MFAQNTAFDWTPSDLCMDVIPQTVEVDTASFSLQGILPVSSQDFYPEGYAQEASAVQEIFQPQVYDQVFELGTGYHNESFQLSHPESQFGTSKVTPSINDSALVLASMVAPSNSNRRQQTPLEILLENGCGDIQTEAGVQKQPHGRRGPLPADRARRIATTRSEKSVCITCRMKKVSVSYPLISCT